MPLPGPHATLLGTMTIFEPPVDVPPPEGVADGVVARERLVRRLTAPGVPVALVVAPAGHGKTTAVAEWAGQDGRPATWLTVRDVPHGAQALLAAIARALDDLAPTGVPDDLAGVLARLHEPRLLVVDDFHLLTCADAVRAVSDLADRLPAVSRLTIVSRTEPGLRLGRLRTRRRVVELGPAHLALTVGEVARLLRTLGLDPPPQVVESLTLRTEGWPAAVYLAAIAAREADDADEALERFSGDDPLMYGYVTDEVLAALDTEETDFLVRTSLLDRLSGPLCDAVLRRTGSAQMLHRLSGHDGLLVPLDRANRSYRHHRVVAETLHAQLSLGDPSVERRAHGRASRWYSQASQPQAAIAHAVAAGDVGAAGDLLFDTVPLHVASGDGEAVHGWLECFSAPHVRSCPALALAAAVTAWTRGEVDRAEHLTTIAAEASDPGADDARARELRAGVLVMRAAVGRDGMRHMCSDAKGANRLLAEHSSWRAHCRLLEGVALHVLGDREDAATALDEGARRGAVGTPGVRALCLAQLALLADERGDEESAAAYAAKARCEVDAGGLSDDPTMALVLAASSMTLAERGLTDRASADIRTATRLLGRLADFVPWYEAEVRVALARGQLRLSHVAAAKALLHEAARALRPVRDAPLLREWIEAAWARTDAYCAAALVAPGLTLAELRVLRLLPTHLSFGEIAQRLFVSSNTIKTQAHAVYRKLDSSSRSGAVARGRELGLLDA